MNDFIAGIKEVRIFLMAGFLFYLAGCVSVPQDPETPEEGTAIHETVESSEVGIEKKEPPVVQKTKTPVTSSKIGSSQVGLEKTLNRLGAKIVPGLESSQWIINKGGVILKFVEGSRRAYWNDQIVFLNKPIVFNEGQMVIEKADVATFLKPALSDLKFKPRSDLIVIDPGHGGSEDGAKNEEMGLAEKELTLDVSNRLKDHLESMGYRTLLTRYDDRLLPLKDRTEIANRENAAVFISIHFNATLNETAEGIETYILTPEGQASTADSQGSGSYEKWAGNDFDALNARFAYEAQIDMLSTLQRKDRGIKKARFAVLKNLECPGVLVECGFVSHKDEALLVRTPVYREKLALSLSRSIDAFMGGVAKQPE
ncbi:N-acetylmuramoyl-L-alanine amidase [Puniceicoccaceae bacterium K14]|nr:N-acetylmuramoyl-L-alanine amidase [Puniceicoccaceae bacterium K14]